MNKQTTDLVVSYINDTLRYGVSESAYEILSHIMKEDRNMANTLHQAYENLVKYDNRYIIGVEGGEGYEL